MPVSGSISWNQPLNYVCQEELAIPWPPSAELGPPCPSPVVTQGGLYLSWPVIALATHPHVLHTRWKSAALHPPGSPCWCENCLAVKRQRAANASREISQEEEMDYWASFPPICDIFEDLSAFEQNTEHSATVAASVTAKQKKGLFFVCLVPLMQADAAQCLFLAARGAGGKSGGRRASKGLSERAPFPPGHILHYPHRWESDNPCMRAHISAHTHTHIHRRMQAITQKQKKLSLLSASVLFVRRQWALALMSLCLRLLCKQIQMWWLHVLPCASAEARTSGRDEEWHGKLDCSTSFYSNFDLEQSRSTLRKRKKKMWPQEPFNHNKLEIKWGTSVKQKVTFAGEEAVVEVVPSVHPQVCTNTACIPQTQS